jgi:hypothetical protein
MTILSINTGSSANKGDGDSLRSAFHKINLNFAYISTITEVIVNPPAPPNLGDIRITGATISTTMTNESIIFDPNGIGNVSFRNTAIQFDNGSNGKGGDSHKQILYTKGAGSLVGLGLDATNSSLRVVGDKDILGTLVDFGLYNGISSSWASKVLIDYQGNVLTQGDLSVGGDIFAGGQVEAPGGIKFGNGTIQSTAASALEVSYITSGTQISNQIYDVNKLRFDTESGFTVIDHGSGTVEIAMNSTFKYWEVAGQPTLIAEGLDHIQIVAGSGISIHTNTGTNPKSITFSTIPQNSQLGELLVDVDTIYSNTSTRGAALANLDIRQSTGGASFIRLPPNSDSIDPMIISSPNEIRLTTQADSSNGIIISPNGDGYGPGYVVIGVSSSSNTSGLFAFSAEAEIDFWPNPSIAYLNNENNPDVGTLDLHTNNGNNISLRPDTTGTVIITSNLNVRQSVVYSTTAPGVGNASSAGNYQTNATRLDETKQVHKLISNDYYLPPGVEGQIVHFVPTTGAGHAIRIWMQGWRSMTAGPAQLIVGTPWLPFSSYIVGNGPSYAIFTDDAWTTSHGFTS